VKHNRTDPEHFHTLLTQISGKQKQPIQQLLTTVLTASSLSSPAASPSLSWRAAEARFYSWRNLDRRHKHLFIHTRASR